MGLENRIDNLFTLWQREHSPGGQILVRQYGQVLYRKCFGYANLEYKMPITSQTLFHIASVSKQITVLALLKLQKEGKLNIDEDIRQYLPHLIRFQEPLSLRQMMNNTSGIRDQWQSLNFHGVRINDTITQQDLLNIISKQKELNFPPGSRYLYSNSNFTLLAEVVQKVSNIPFKDYVRENILKPLNMTMTQVKDNFDEILPLRATSYQDDGQNSFKTGLLSYAVYGATSVQSNVDDFSKLLNYYRQAQKDGDPTFKLMTDQPLLTTGERSNYGGGLMLGTYKNHPYFEHSGADSSYRAHMLRFTEDDLDILIFANTQNLPLNLVARRIANIVLELSEEKPDILESQKHFSERAKPGLYVSEDNSTWMHLQFDPQKNAFKNGETFLKHLEHNHYRLGTNPSEYYFNPRGLTEFIGSNKTEYKLLPDKSIDQGDSYGYCGLFYSNEIETFYEIQCRDNHLYFKHFRHGENRLYQSAETPMLFFGSNGIKFRFCDQDKGRFNSLVLEGGRVLGLKLKRVTT